ncbi:MAG: DUF29 domain-containing protein [Pseudomonadota bacterium]|nr:DUF29 domain-containing protein [Pseudomonadota bacterium]
MAQTVLPQRTAYADDHAAWIEQQVALLRAGRFDELDLQNLVEELEALVRSERRELQSRLEVLLTHLLKWDHQPNFRSRSWELTIREQRRRLRELLDESPSLRGALQGIAPKAYRGAVVEAIRQTGLDRSVFPPSMPYSVDDLLADGGDEAAEG